MPNEAILTREQAQAIVEKAVKWSKAEVVDVQVNTYTRGNIRFADNQVSTAGSTTRRTPCARAPRAIRAWSPGRTPSR